MRAFSATFYLAGLTTIHQAASHSWIVCTDYTEKNAATYSHDKCRGYPRNGHQKVSGTFGQDTGYNTQPGTNGDPCATGLSRDDNARYTTDYPMATYFAGQQVVLAHPMKNHGAEAGVTNIYIPDHGSYVWRGEKDATSDVSFAQFKQNKVADLGTSLTGNTGLTAESSKVYPKPGFQNAPLFKEGTDKALGTYSFNVPADLEAGRYTFVWDWRFNGNTDSYTTCFEVDIVQTKAERDVALGSNGYSDVSVACGGTTSDNGAGSSTGCTETDVTTTTESSNGGSSSTETDSSTSTTTTTTTTTTTSTSSSGAEAHVLAEQVSGFINLSSANGATKRSITVSVQCENVSGNFWYIDGGVEKRIDGDDTVFEMEQVQSWAIAQGRIGYSLRFDSEPCDLLAYPILATVNDSS